MKKSVQKSKRSWKFSLIPVLIMLILWKFNPQISISSNSKDLSEMQTENVENNEYSQHFSPSSSGTNIYNIESTQIWNNTLIESIWTDNFSIYECGSIRNEITYSSDFYLGKRDLEGNQIWNRTWIGFNGGYGMSIWGDETGLYVGLISSMLCKFDLDGNLIWNRSMPVPYCDPKITLWGDGICIYTYGVSFDDLDRSFSYLLKLNKDGETIWNRTWYEPDGNYTLPFAIYGNFNSVFTIETYYLVPGNGYTLRKWNLNGESIWNRTWNSTNWHLLSDVWINENSIYITGDVYYYQNESTALFLSKWDLIGNYEWTRYLNQGIYDIEETLWGNENTIFLISQTTILNNPTSNGLLLIAFDNDGYRLWDTIYVGIGGYYGMTLCGNDHYLIVEGKMYGLFDSYHAGFCITYKIEPTAPILNSLIQFPENSSLIAINWIEIPNSTYYNVYRSNCPIYSSTDLTPIASVVGDEYTDHLEHAGWYFYSITSVNETGESSLSNCKGICVDFLTSSMPFISQCAYLSDLNCVYLDWDNMDGANFYYVYCSTSFIDDPTNLYPIATTEVSEYYDFISHSGRYYYVIIAAGNYGVSNESNQVSIYVQLPQTTSFICECVFLSDSNCVYINWNVVPDADFYYVYRSTSFISDTAILSPITTTESTKYYDFVSNSGRYYYIITAIGYSGVINESNQVSIYVQLPAPTYTATYPTHQGFEFGELTGFLVTGIFVVGLVFVIFILSRNSHSESLHPSHIPETTVSSYSFSDNKQRMTAPETNQPLKSGEIKYCGQCGSINDPFSNYCFECGSKLD